MGNLRDKMAAANVENNVLGMASENENKDKKPRDKHADFLRITPARVDKVINSIHRLELTANRKSYSYSDDEVEQIFSAITDAVNHARAAFDGKKNSKSKFMFKE